MGRGGGWPPASAGVTHQGRGTLRGRSAIARCRAASPICGHAGAPFGCETPALAGSVAPCKGTAASYSGKVASCRRSEASYREEASPYGRAEASYSDEVASCSRAKASCRDEMASYSRANPSYSRAEASYRGAEASCSEEGVSCSGGLTVLRVGSGPFPSPIVLSLRRSPAGRGRDASETTGEAIGDDRPARPGAARDAPSARYACSLRRASTAASSGARKAGVLPAWRRRRCSRTAPAR